MPRKRTAAKSTKERTGISLPPELMRRGQTRATKLGRSFSGHIVELIRADLESATQP